MIQTTLSRALAARELTDTAAVLRTTSVTNAEGGQTETEAVVATLPCNLQADRTVPQERVEGGRVVAVNLWTCYFEAGVEILPTDVLLIDGIRYQAVDDDRARSNSATVRMSLRQIT